ncbi:FG-GAP-like repeat-containing protein [Actinacidiphila rubida]|uniref:Repeat domain-containing protein n=1 Tax=Actinacidiphila rubida TaxID=310780 RepID=A0A1H8UIX3_9ACTN|nr:FG-GAP-like repeat-containing protein [Actinacidiphila rubida]SEP03170.1 Repeat domain-containing protein [Actinacidiphila rubida]
MTRSTTVLRRGLVAALAAVAAMTGPLPQLAHADAAPPAPGEVTIPASYTPAPYGPHVVGAAANGYLLEDIGYSGGTSSLHDVWQPADGSAAYDFGQRGAQMGVTGSGAGLVWRTEDGGGLGVYDTATTAWTTYGLPASASGAQLLGIVPTSQGWSLAALQRATDDSGQGTGADLHLYSTGEDGYLSDRTVAGWPSAGVISSFVPSASVPGELLLQPAGIAGQNPSVLVDTDTATVVATGPHTNATPLLNRRTFGWGYPDGTAVLRSIDDPQGPARTLSAPPGAAMALTDSALVAGAPRSPVTDGTTGSPLDSIPLDGTPSSVILQNAGGLRASPDGSVLVDVQSAPQTWATDRVPRDGGAPGVLQPFTTAVPQDVGLSLARGELHRAVLHAGATHLGAAIDGVDVGTAGAPDVATAPRGDAGMPDAAIPRCGGARCLDLVDGGGTAGVSYATQLPGHPVVTSVKGRWYVDVGQGSGHFVSAAGNRVLYDNTTTGTQYLVDLATPQTLQVRRIVAAALWGDTMWTATSTAGRLTAENAADGSGSRTVTTDAPCVPDEIQALGRWLYWSCGTDGPAGVWDSTGGRSVRVPAGHALLGDGYVLRHTGGQLVVTDIHAGTAAADRVVAALPAGSVDDDRNVTWTVDKYRGFLAYTDAEGTAHVLPSGVPQSAIAVLAGSGTASADVSKSGWTPVWTITGPVASWRVDLRRKGASALVRTFTGDAAPAAVSPVWDGKDQSGHLVVDGDFTWTLTFAPANGEGPPATVTGPLTVTGHPAPAHDFTGEGTGDLLALTSTGRLDLRPGSGTVPGGVGATSASAAGWPSTSLLVTTGDMTGDGADDLLVRDASGRLTRYDGTAGHAFGPSGGHHLIGAGWNIYNALIAPGDVTGDGRPDLLARDSGGSLYLYAATGAGVFAPRQLIGRGWNVYGLIAGGHDLHGLGDGSLVARDAAGILWEYRADGRGAFTGRVRIGAGWNVYNALVGVGDIDGDHFDDLIARDAKGDLYFYSSKGGGTFRPRVKIGWSWQSYKSLI